MTLGMRLARVSAAIDQEGVSIPSTLGKAMPRASGNGFADRPSWAPKDGTCGTCGQPARIEHYQSTVDGVTSTRRVVRCLGEKRPVKGCKWVQRLNCCPTITEPVESEETMPKMSKEWGDSIREKARAAGLILADVAERAGLGLTTVKNGVTGHNTLSPEAAAKIEAAVEGTSAAVMVESKLHPDFIARADILMTKHGWTVGELANWLPGYIKANVLKRALERKSLNHLQLNTIEVGICELENKPDSYFKLEKELEPFDLPQTGAHALPILMHPDKVVRVSIPDAPEGKPVVRKTYGWNAPKEDSITVSLADWTCEVCGEHVQGTAAHVCVTRKLPITPEGLLKARSDDDGIGAQVCVGVLAPEVKPCPFTAGDVVECIEFSGDGTVLAVYGSTAGDSSYSHVIEVQWASSSATFRYLWPSYTGLRHKSEAIDNATGKPLDLGPDWGKVDGAPFGVDVAMQAIEARLAVLEGKTDARFAEVETERLTAIEDAVSRMELEHPETIWDKEIADRLTAIEDKHEALNDGCTLRIGNLEHWARTVPKEVESLRSEIEGLTKTLDTWAGESGSCMDTMARRIAAGERDVRNLGDRVDTAFEDLSTRTEEATSETLRTRNAIEAYRTDAHNRLTVVESEVNSLAKAIDHCERYLEHQGDLCDNVTEIEDVLANHKAVVEAHVSRLDNAHGTTDRALATMAEKLAELTERVDLLRYQAKPSVPLSERFPERIGLSTLFDILVRLSESQLKSMFVAADSYRRMAESLPEAS